MTDPNFPWEHPDVRFVECGVTYHVFEAPLESTLRGTCPDIGDWIKAIVFTTSEGEWIGRAIVGRSLHLRGLQMRGLHDLLAAARSIG